MRRTFLAGGHTIHEGPHVALTSAVQLDLDFYRYHRWRRDSQRDRKALSCKHAALLPRGNILPVNLPEGTQNSGQTFRRDAEIQPAPAPTKKAAKKRQRSRSRSPVRRQTLRDVSSWPKTVISPGAVGSGTKARHVCAGRVSIPCRSVCSPKYHRPFAN